MNFSPAAARCRTWIHVVAAIVMVTVAVTVALASEPTPEPTTFGATGLRHAVLWYSAAPNDAVRQSAARRYVVGVTGKGEQSDVDKPIIKSLNPEFRWFMYNSGIDNYVVPHPLPPAEHELLTQMALQRGWDPEEGYAHYWDDTRVVMYRDTLFVPGWGGGSAPNGAAARIPIYYDDMSRRIVHFSTRRAAQLHKELFLHVAFDTPFNKSTLYPDGIFLDNSALELYNYGTILSGGHMREAPGHLRLDSREFRTWYWNNNLAPFLTALKDTLELSPSWSPDGKRKYLMINVSGTWDDSFVSRDVADILFLEYQYSPVRSFGTGMVDEAHRRDVLAAAAGITSFYGSVVRRDVAGRAGSYSYGQALLGNMAWYLVSRTENTLYFPMETSAPGVAGWDTLTWRGCYDVANDRFGRVAGDPFTLASGVDPKGNAYVVKARRYDNGLAVVRNVGDWDEDLDASTAVAVPLPQSLLPVDLAGNIGSAVQSVRLRNGEGALFLKSGVPSTFTLSVGWFGSGMVRLNPYQSSYAAGSVVSLWAVPSLGWRFARWGGDLAGAGSPVSVRMDANRTVSAVFTLNKLPVAAADGYAVASGMPLRIPAPGVLGNDRDPDADPLTAALVTAPVNGHVALGADGGFVYIAAPGFRGTDSFVYSARDNFAGTATATATLDVSGAAVEVLFAEARAGGSTASASVSAPMGTAAGSLYLAAVASKPSRSVTSVTGLGLAWTPVLRQCSGRGQTIVDLWMARGNASAGAVTATFANAPLNAVIAVCRYTGVDLANPLGAIASGNTNGPRGSCAGGVDGGRYELAIASPGLVFGAIATRNKTHTPDPGTSERIEFHQGSGGDDASIAIVDRAGGTVSLDGSASSDTDWAAAALALRSAAGGAAKSTVVTTGRPALRLVPNPARGATTIACDLPPGSVVQVTIYDAAGRRVRHFAPFTSTVSAVGLAWDGHDDLGQHVPSGVYFVTARFGSTEIQSKLVLQK